MAKFICPICLAEYDKRDIEYNCTACDYKSKRGLFERLPVKCKNPKGCKGTGYATQCVCPKCGQDIPSEALETENLTFSIVGVAASGKTNYITTMVAELMDVPRISVISETPETKSVYEHNRNLIYERHRKLEGTEASGNTQTLSPQIWCIKNMNKRHGDTVPTYTFTIYDGAGEDYEKRLNPSDMACKSIVASKAIILLLDPLILPNIKKPGVIDPDVMRSSLVGQGQGTTESDETKIVQDLARYIKTIRGVRTDKVLDIPVAVVLSKFDTIMSHPSFSRDALVKQPSMVMQDGRVNLDEINQVDEEIRDWLYAIDEGNFIDALDANFKNYKLFGVSSFGGAPSISGSLPSIIKPHRVLDPLLWLFKKFKFVD